MDMLELLNLLCPPLGPSGREDEIREVISGLVPPLADKVEVDRMGNLQAWLNPDARPLVMLDAHMDEVGLMVQRVEDSGFLRVAPLGGLDPRLLPGTRVVLQPRPGKQVEGVVAMAPPHISEPGDKDKALGWDKLFVDTGLRGAEEVIRAGVEVGTPGVLMAASGRLGTGAYCARNLDDRAGCALLVDALAQMRQARPSWGLVCNFATSEEVGLRGAATATFHLNPDIALAVECTVGDTPGVEAAKQPTILGKGPAVTVADGRVLVPWRMVESLEEAASRAGVACQRKLPPYGGTDAGAISQSRAGVPTGVLSIPTRYIHSPSSLLYLSDLEDTQRTLLSWLQRVETLL
jgi:endoglucanase